MDVIYLLRWDTEDLGIFELIIDQSRRLNLEKGNELFARNEFEFLSSQMLDCTNKSFLSPSVEIIIIERLSCLTNVGILG